MEFFVPLAAKSLLVAGITLLILKAMRRRSAADRSFVAHLGLGAIVLLPAALFLLPQMEVESSLLGSKEPLVMPMPLPQAAGEEAAASSATFPGAVEPPFWSTVDWGLWAYIAPAALLLLLTLIALARLVVLKAKANVLVEPNWLTALARAQQRMGFKHGTALLTSDDLRSPISWGLMRPVILLNSEAAEAHDEAEAIIAHELAHVARLDWVKLLLSRVTVALFWFNPLVWLLAREAHQLREEAADDAVLGSDIEDTDYAKLLVGIARHECRGLLIGAHGVAPGRTSLARRVQRVLDAASARAPGGWRWTAAAGFFAAGMAVPLATLQFVPMSPAAANASTVGGKAPALAGGATATVPSGAVEAAASAASVHADAAASAVAALVGDKALPQDLPAGLVAMTQPNGASITNTNGQVVMRSPAGGTITIAAPDAQGRRRTVMVSPNGSTIAYSDARAVPGLSAVPGLAAVTAHPHPQPPRPPRPPRDDAIDRAVELKAVGATADYVRAIRSAAPHLRLDHDDIVQLRALGVSPAYLRELASSGYSNLDADDVVQAKALGITGSYVRAITAAYGRVSMDTLVEMKAVGVTPADIERYRRANRGLPSVDKLVELKALGITPEDLKAADSP